MIFGRNRHFEFNAWIVPNVMLLPPKYVLFQNGMEAGNLGARDPMGQGTQGTGPGNRKPGQ